MRTVFMGTPDFAVPSLRTLAEVSEVAAVFTQPDKPKGRGYKLIPTPVKVAALEFGFPVYQPTSLRKGEEAEEVLYILREFSPDLIVVTAYGQILPKEILDLPKYGCINIHASLLPKYRGAAPIQRSILDGEKITGITSMQMDVGLDTGDMLVKVETEIGENETFAQLHDRLALIGGDVLKETVKQLKNGELKPEKQDGSLATYASVITKEMCCLDFSKTAETVHNTIRGITGYTMLDGKRLKVFRSSVAEGDCPTVQNGEIADENSFTVKCSGGLVRFEEVQIEGGKRLRTEDFLRGRKLIRGTVLGGE